MKEKIQVSLPVELAEEMDSIVELLGFGDRNKLVEASVRRLLDQYKLSLGRVERKRLRT
ncbi:hypothetical protein KEJ47_09590 [Candidatus Bathyarchaeota archaeon]|nr:hypothetical protein [Candidatus Bathyarchaeota archaeon]